MNAKLGLLAFVFIFALLLAGCAQQAPTSSQQTAAGYPTPDRYATFSFSNNTTSSAITLGGVMAVHAFSYNYLGNWSTCIANVTLQGSVDNIVWTPIGSEIGNGSNTTFVVNSPVVYVRFNVTSWNASTNASLANLTVNYVGKG